MSYSYQEATKKEHTNTIVKLLNKQPLTFTELIKKSGLSRGTINQHLKDLQRDGKIKKEYRDGKILNLLVHSKLDLVEWFLNQLESSGVPRKIVKKGKDILNEDILVLSVCIYIQIWENIFQMFKSREKILETATVITSSEMHVIPPKTKTPNINFSEVYKKDRYTYKVLKAVIRELNPYSFNIIASVYQFERLINNQDLKNKSLHLSIMERPEWVIPEDLKTDFDKVLEWWFEEVSEYIPSSGFLKILTVVYFDTLLKSAQITK